MRGRMGVSNVPFGDLSVSEDASDASVAAFLFSNSILSCHTSSEKQNPSKPSSKKMIGREVGLAAGPKTVWTIIFRVFCKQ